MTTKTKNPAATDGDLEKVLKVLATTIGRMEWTRERNTVLERTISSLRKALPVFDAVAKAAFEEQVRVARKKWVPHALDEFDPRTAAEYIDQSVGEDGDFDVEAFLEGEGEKIAAVYVASIRETFADLVSRRRGRE